MCRVGTNATVRMGEFTGQGNRTEGIALFKFKDVDNLGPSTAMTNTAFTLTQNSSYLVQLLF